MSMLLEIADLEIWLHGTLAWRAPRMAIPQGSVVSIASENPDILGGLVYVLSGKSELLPSGVRCNGRITISGDGVASEDPRHFAIACPYLTYANSSDLFFTVGEELGSLPMSASDSLRPKAKERSIAAMRHFQMEKFEKRAIRSLSGGEQRLVGLVGALMSPRPVKIIEDVTRNLDDTNRRSIMTWLAHDTDSIYLILDSDLDEISHVASAFLCIDSKGRSEFFDSASSLIRSDVGREVCLGLPLSELFVCWLSAGQNSPFKSFGSFVKETGPCL